MKITGRDMKKREVGLKEYDRKGNIDAAGTRLLAACSFTAAAFVLPAVCTASGFSIYTQGAGPMSVGNASVAHAEGLSSIYFNPALQLDFEGTNGETGTTLVIPKKKVDSSITMEQYESEDAVYTPVHFAVSSQINDRASIALNVNNSFGLGSDFGEDTVFCYIATESEMTTWDLNPTFGYKMHKMLAVAAGVRIVYTDVSLKRMIPLSSYGLSDGRQDFSVDGTGYGYNLGVVFSPVENWHLGLSYRSPVDVELSGEVEFDLPGVGGSQLTQVFPKTDAETELSLPGQLFLGLAWQPGEKWVVELGARLEQYSSYDELEVTTDYPVAGQTSQVLPKNWDDVWGYLAGVSYQTDIGLRFSAGYIYEENPVPDETFEPTVSGLDKQTFTVGVAQEVGDLTARVSYAYDLYEDREIQNSGTAALVNGNYSQTNHMLSISLGYHF